MKLTHTVRIKTKIKIDGKMVTVSLIRGPVARIYYPKKSPCGPEKPFRFWRFINGKGVTSYHSMSELDRITKEAETTNDATYERGRNYVIPTEEEANALRLFREFCEKEKEYKSQIRGEQTSSYGRIDEDIPSLYDVVKSALDWEKSRNATELFSKVAADYIEDRRSSGIKEQSIRTMKSHLTILLEKFGNRRLGDITAGDIDALLKELSREPPKGRIKRKVRNSETVKHYYATVRAIFRWAYQQINMYRPSNKKLLSPLDGYRSNLPAGHWEPKAIKPVVLAKYLEFVRANKMEWLPGAVLQAFCGCRRQEVIRLRWSSIQARTTYDKHYGEGFDEYGRVVLLHDVTKTQLTRGVPILPCAAAWLKLAPSHKPDDFIIFPKVKGEMRELTVGNLLSHFHDKLDASIKFDRNALRHSAATYLYAIHGITEAADMCGHSIQIAKTHYYDVTAFYGTALEWFKIFPETL